MRVAMLGWIFLSVILVVAGCDSGDAESSALEGSGANTNLGGEEGPGGPVGDGQSESPDSDNGSDALSDLQDEDQVDTEGGAGNPRVTFQTTLGDFTVELNAEVAPVTTANILSYAESGFYDGKDGLGATSFHRVIPGFMVQGGGITAAGVNKATQPPIVSESSNGLPNIRGSVAMARTDDPNSATSQFFVNVVDNGFLNYSSPAESGYTVFGSVVEGMETVDAIAAVATDATDVPLEAIEILDVVVE